MTDNKPKLIVILGPTASGKSDLAVEIALKYNGEVVSADSRQVYKGLDIGSGKVDGKWINESKNLSSRSHLSRHSTSFVPPRGTTFSRDFFVFNGVRHHLLDFVEPQNQYSVAEYQKDAEKAIQSILERGKLPILCGGTGFYIQSIVDGFVPPKVEADWNLRKCLGKKPVEELFEMLKKLDPERAKNIDAKNPHRLIRAIEIAKKLGKVPSLKNLPRSDLGKFDILQIGIKLSDEILKERIGKRIREMIEPNETKAKTNSLSIETKNEGLLEEIEKLFNPPGGGGLSWERIEEFGFEYKYPAMYLQGLDFGGKEIIQSPAEKEKMIEKTILANWQYVKRQMTWFKRDERINWIDSNRQENAEELVEEFLKK